MRVILSKPMDEILKLLEEGKFEINISYITLESGIKIWCENGWIYYRFYPDLNTKFTMSEKLRIRAALKKGLIVKAVKKKESTK